MLEAILRGRLISVSARSRIGWSASGPNKGEAKLQRAKNPLDIVIDIESQRVRLGIPTKQALAKMAGMKPEMYSYLLRRGREGGPLPVACLSKVQRALQRQKEKS